MEGISEDEARNLASQWVRRFESSFLARVNSVDSKTLDKLPNAEQPERSVICDYRSYKKNDLSSNHEIFLSNCQKSKTFRKKSQQSEEFHCSSFRSSNSSSSSDDLKLENEIPPQRRCIHDLKSSKRENNYCDLEVSSSSRSDSHGGENESVLQRQNVTTPRADPEYLRLKRLQYFDAKSNNTKPESEERSRDDCVLKSCQLPREIGLPGSMQSSTSWEKNNGNKCVAINPNKKLLPCHWKNEEEEFRLDLWGLKDAVLSGQVHLDSYLPVNSAVTSNCDPNFNIEDKTIVSLSQNFTAIKPDMLKYQLGTDCGKCDKTKSNCNSVHEGEKGELGNPWPNEKQTSSANRMHSLLGKNKYGISDSDLMGLKSRSPPEPQIKGPLYSGFDTQSDSDGSLANYIIKKVDKSNEHSSTYHKSSSLVLGQSTVPTNKSAVSNQNSVEVSKSLIHKERNNKTKDKRGREKILSEFTEYMKTKKPVQKQIANGYATADSSKCNGFTTSAKSCEESLDVLRQNTFSSQTNEGQLKENIFSETNGKEPLAVISACTDGVFDVFEFDEDICSTPVENVGDVKAKVCPHCHEINSSVANWCIECGTALVKIRPSSLTTPQLKQYKKQVLAAKNLLTESCAIDRNSNLRVSLMSQSVPEKLKDKNDGLHLSLEKLSMQASYSEAFDNDKYSSSPVGYKRRWLKSSTAWNTYNSRELLKPSSVDDKFKVSKNKKGSTNVIDQGVRKVRSSSDLSIFSNTSHHGRNYNKSAREKSSTQRRTLRSGSFGDDCCSIQKSKTVKSQPQSHSCTKSSPSRKLFEADSAKQENAVTHSLSAVSRNDEDWSGKTIPENWEPHIPSRSCSNRASVPPLDLSDLATYDRILTLIRSQRESEPVPYLCLPDEILLQIFCFLSHKDLASCAQVCQQFYRIASDETLWKVIVLRKSENICDDWLINIGKRHPVCLTISQCHGKAVSSEGLRNLFRSCSSSLQELDFSGSSGGELIGESIMLHVAARCTGLRSVDASWCNVSDNGVQALAEQVERLECLCLNGCQAITDASLKFVAKKHGKSLRILEVFGCFNITPSCLYLVGKSCTHLETLNIGQCYKITDSAIEHLVCLQTELENLDLRGCKLTRDAAVKKIVRQCPNLISLVLANCPLITNISLAEIATNLPRIRTLDFCGCANVTDSGVRALAKGCQSLEALDLSSTGITNKSVTALANYCSQSLITLKLSFCLDITDSTVNLLAKHCKKLATLHLYGCKRVRDIKAVQSNNGNLHIER